MPNFAITHDDTDWGSYEADDSETALMKCLQSSEPHVQWRVTFLSNSPSYGTSTPGRIQGKGGDDTSRFWYVRQDANRVGIYRASSIPV
jgi:hypothetical protein